MEKRQRFVLIGAGAVGKSAIRSIWCYGDKLQDPTFDPTIEAIDQREIIVDGIKEIIEIFDSGFQFSPDMPNNVNTNLIKEADGFVLIYSITDRQSLTYITERYNDILKIKNCEKCPMVLVANKMDLVNSDHPIILSEEGITLAKKLGIPFVETSALKGPPERLNDVFVALVKESRRKSEPEEAPDRRRCIIA